MKIFNSLVSVYSLPFPGSHKKAEEFSIQQRQCFGDFRTILAKIFRPEYLNVIVFFLSIPHQFKRRNY